MYRNPPVVTESCDSNNSLARHHHSLKLGSKLIEVSQHLHSKFRYSSGLTKLNCMSEECHKTKH